MESGYVVVVMGEANIKTVLFFDVKPDVDELDKLIQQYQAKKTLVFSGESFQSVGV